jgi:hypothetical protein
MTRRPPVPAMAGTLESFLRYLEGTPRGAFSRSKYGYWIGAYDPQVSGPNTVCAGDRSRRLAFLMTSWVCPRRSDSPADA